MLSGAGAACSRLRPPSLIRSFSRSSWIAASVAWLGMPQLFAGVLAVVGSLQAMASLRHRDTTRCCDSMRSTARNVRCKPVPAMITARAAAPAAARRTASCRRTPQQCSTTGARHFRGSCPAHPLFWALPRAKVSRQRDRGTEEHQHLLIEGPQYTPLPCKTRLGSREKHQGYLHKHRAGGQRRLTPAPYRKASADIAQGPACVRPVAASTLVHLAYVDGAISAPS